MEKLPLTNKEVMSTLNHWAAEIVRGNISIYTMNQLADAQGWVFSPGASTSDSAEGRGQDAVSTVSEELVIIKKDIARLVAEIAQGKFNIDTLSQLAVARGKLFVMDVLSLGWESKEDRRASAERWVVESGGKSEMPGAGSLLYKAEVVAFNRYLSGELVFIGD